MLLLWGWAPTSFSIIPGSVGASAPFAEGGWPSGECPRVQVRGVGGDMAMAIHDNTPVS